MPKALEPASVAVIVLGVIVIVALCILQKDALVLAISVCSGIAGWLSQKQPSTSPSTSDTKS